MKLETTYLKTTYLAVVAAGFILLTPGSVYAEQKGHFPIALEEIQARQARHFDTLDQNNDETVTLAEFETSPGLERMEHRRHGGRRMHDKRMHDKHSQRLRPAQREQRKEMRKAAEQELFVILDTNNDGSLSQQEHTARSRDTIKLARKRAAFAQLDSDKDGVLTINELPSRLERLNEADSNGDGQVTRKEMRHLRHSKPTN